MCWVKCVVGKCVVGCSVLLLCCCVVGKCVVGKVGKVCCW